MTILPRLLVVPSLAVARADHEGRVAARWEETKAFLDGLGGANVEELLLEEEG